MAVMSTAEVSSQRIDVPAPGRYQIQPERSTVTLRTRHFFGLGAVRAVLALRDGRIQVTEPPSASAVQASFAVSTFQSGILARDAAVLAPRLLDAEAYPSISFISTGLTQQDGHWTLRGELEVRGVTRPVAVAVIAVAAGQATLRANARVVIDRHDFGITSYRGLAGRTLTVDLAIVADLAVES